MGQHIGPLPRTHVLRSVTVLALMVPMLAPVVGSAPVAAQSSLTQTLQSAVTARMQELRVPGAVILVQDPKIGTWMTAIGTSDLKTQAPITTDMHFRIGSITKTFTGTVILQLVDEGKLRLDDPIAKYQPAVPNGANITIRQLLQMTSGLYNYTEDLAWNQALDANPQRVWTQKELLDIALAHPPYFAPGTDFHYSNTNTVLLGLVIEQITGNHVTDEFARRIFNPLGMRDTVMPPLTVAAIPDPHPRGYLYGTNVESLTAPVLTGDAAAKANAAAGTPNDWTDMNPSWGWTAGSAISTVHDMQIWAKALATGTLISAAAQRERLMYVPPGYGLAVVQIAGYIGHNGSLPGFQSQALYNPTTDSTIVVLTNLQNSPSGQGTADELAMLIIQQLVAQTPQPAPPATAAPGVQANRPFFIRRLGDG
jgi:D-alanyl-D-alanine carboxypeptidase